MCVCMCVCTHAREISDVPQCSPVIVLPPLSDLLKCFARMKLNSAQDHRQIVVTYCSVRWNGIIYWINAKQFSDHIGGKISLEVTPKQKTKKLSAAAGNILDSCFGFRTEGTQFSFCLCSTPSRKGVGGGSI